MNQRMMDRDLKAAADRWHAPTHLIDPLQEPLEYHRDRPYPFGTPSSLPAVGAGALFNSLSPIDPDRGRSWTSDLTVVWYQAEWAMPIEDSILEQLTTLDWTVLARDREI